MLDSSPLIALRMRRHRPSPYLSSLLLIELLRSRRNNLILEDLMSELPFMLGTSYALFLRRLDWGLYWLFGLFVCIKLIEARFGYSFVATIADLEAFGHDFIFLDLSWVLYHPLIVFTRNRTSTSKVLNGILILDLVRASIIWISYKVIRVVQTSKLLRLGLTFHLGQWFKCLKAIRVVVRLVLRLNGLEILGANNWFHYSGFLVID